jgi:hypothetical protein
MTALLDSWNGDDLDDLREQTETLALLKRTINEDRLSYRERMRVSGDETLAALMESPLIVTDPNLTDEERRRKQVELNGPAITLLQSWLEDGEESEEEQRASLEELKRAIDSHRPTGAKLFT